jgi:hypothetical protein
MTIQETTPEMPPPLNPHDEASPEKAAALKGIAIGIGIALLGILLLTAIALLEENWLKDLPWRQALFTPEITLKDDDAITIHVRNVPKENFPPTSEFIELLRADKQGQQLIDSSGIEKTEFIVAADIPVETFQPLLYSGRLPTPGTPELLAGPLARLDAFILDDTQFEVVGKIHPGVSGFAFAYLLPNDPALKNLFSPEASATQGTLHPEGLTKLPELLDTLPESEEEESTSPIIVGGRALTAPGFAWGTWLGLIITMAGGAYAQFQCIKLLAARGSTPTQPPNTKSAERRLLQPLFQAIAQRPRLLLGTHIALLGTFFGVMAFGITEPHLSRLLTNYIAAAFAQGQLSYIGDAYASENILRAATATFTQNYLINTLGLTFGISIIPLALGALKTAASFALVGLGMAPLWTGTAAGYTYHSITMILELEPYVIASFVVILWPIYLLKGYLDNNLLHQAKEGARIFTGGIILTAMMLAVAALYEATTLILLR